MMHRSKLLSISAIILLLFSWLVFAQDEDDDEDYLPPVEIKNVADMQALLRQADRENKVILLEMSASYCGYCETLEEHIIKPMIRSGDYTDHVLIRKLDIDSRYPMKDVDGSTSSPAQIAYRLDVSLTPTLLFLDGEGNEVSERILGVNTLELYGAYVDEALLQGQQKLKLN